MKNKFKLFEAVRSMAIIALAAVIGLTFTACPDEDGVDTDEDGVDTFVAVTLITNVPTNGAVGVPLALSGTVNPEDATNNAIVWSIPAPVAGIALDGNTLNATAPGTVTVLATIADGKAKRSDYAQDFTVNFVDNGTPGLVFTLINNETAYEVGGRNLSGNVTIPAVYNGKPVTAIGKNGFCYSGITGITIPNSVTYIESGAFAYCTSLVSITIPNSVGDIAGRDSPGNYLGAFEGCTSLASITIPNSVIGIGHSVFRDCSSLTSITIPNSVTYIGNGTFAYCTSLTSVNIGNGITSINGRSSYAFYDSKGLFEGCSSLASVTIPNSVTRIEDNAFAGCSSLASVTIPNSVTSIGVAAFQDCSNLASVTIPNSVTDIKEWTFAGCSSLASVTIPNSVTSIGVGAFFCESLASVTFQGEIYSARFSASSFGNNLRVYFYEINSNYGTPGTYVTEYLNDRYTVWQRQ